MKQITVRSRVTSPSPRRRTGESSEETRALGGRQRSREEKTLRQRRRLLAHLIRPGPPVKPFALTRKAPHAKIFRAGCPSLASAMVGDSHDEHWRLGELTDQGAAKTTPEVRRAAQWQEEQEEEQVLHEAREGVTERTPLLRAATEP